MVDITVPTFKGPLTAVEVNEWLLSCESAFKTYDLQHTDKLSSELKANLAGGAISRDGVTHELADWWANYGNDITTWDAFKDEVKEKALGAYWKTSALQSFYSTKQDTAGDKGADAYIRSLEENRSVINHDGKLEAIGDMVYKCHLLFHALPAVVSTLMDNDFDVVDATVSQVETKVRHQSSLQSSSIPVPMPSSGFAGYLVLPAWGVMSGTRFSDLDTQLPNDPRSLTRLSSITVWANNNTSYHMIEDYSFGYVGGAISGPGLKPKSEAKTYNFATDEYITSISIGTISYSTYNGSSTSAASGVNSLCYLAISTSSDSGSTKLVIGNANSSISVFSAPTGWKIVGFRGYSTSYLDYNAGDSSSYRYPIVAFGVIIAPVKA